MMKETVLSRSLRMMFASGAAVGLSLVAQQAIAQQEPSADKITRVEITGSSIKRIAVEGALPVQTLSKAQIEQSGATTVADLVASLPSMQGFLTSAASINGGGGGIQTASVHGIGDAYTLVLLNGHRIAPYNTGSAVNLASIPLSAVERVEILTDGASALYGSDAIAGVVNFILKKNQQDANIELTYSRPQHKRAGDTSNIAISKGFGDLNKDGFNVLLAYSHDTQSELLAADRSFSAQGGVHPFSDGGKNYTMYQLSSNSIPGNVTVKQAGQPNVSFGPSAIMDGACPAPNTFLVGKRCLFNYAATVADVPELKRDGFFASGTFIVNDKLKFFAEGLYSKFSSTAAFAPPAQPLSLDRSTTLYKQFVEPALVKQGIVPANVTSATMNLRLVDAGRRTDEWKTEAKHLVIGAEGDLGKMGYNVSYTHSENKSVDSAVAGYTSGDMLASLIANGTYNPFIAPTDATKAALAPAVLHQVLDTTVSKIDVASARGNMELFKMSGGAAQLGFGADFSRQSYIDNPSAIAQGPNKLQPNWTDTNVGGGTGALPIDSSRNSYGAFAEMVMPVVKNLEVTLAARYDSYEKVKNAKNFDVNGDLTAAAEQGNTASAVTYKIAAAYRPMDSLLIRAGYGTGFKAPILSDVTLPLVNGGSSGFHPCPITSGPLLPLCNGTAEYGLLSGGNAASGDNGLKPEKSKQATFGFRIEPMKSLSLGLDLWDVKLRDQINTLPENTVFNDPVRYAALFSSYYDPIQKENVLVAALTPFNLSTSHFRGLDWDHTFRTNTPIGKVSVNWTGTYMLKSEFSPVAGEPAESSIGRFDSYNNVIFRTVSRLATSWQQSPSLYHTMTVSYHSGYHDAPILADDGAVREVLADGSLGDYVDHTRDVKAYTVLDWQTKWKFNSHFTLTGGIKNLLDRDPPFSQRIAGGGNYSGYDGRYTDPLGRQFYLVGAYKF
jgi:iron complex outermembrane receptor protein